MFQSKEGEPVEPERWQWVAIQNDGTELLQFDYADHIYNYFGSIDHANTARFGLVHPETNRRFMIDIPQGSKLIHFYDNIIQSPLGGTPVQHRLYSFGYELGKEKTIYTVLPNDFIVEAEANKIGVL